MRTLTIGSLFSGIGGLDLGLECALRDRGYDVSTTWQCEADSWCRGILARHWPDALRHDDVRRVGPIPYAQPAEAVDVLCGGFPCQDVSVAGKGAGLDGERSGLWFEFLRIIREIRPRIIVVENVAALAFRGLDVVLGGLSEAGYDALWFDLRASDVGAPHRRERLFIVAWRRDLGDAAGARLQGHRDVTSGTRPQHSGARGVRGWLAQPRVGRDADGLPHGLDLAAHRWPVGPGEAQPVEEPPRVTQDRTQRRQRLKALGNAVAPQQAYVVGCVVAAVMEAR